MLRALVGAKINEKNSLKTLVLDLLDLFVYVFLILFYFGVLVEESKTKIVENRSIIIYLWIIVVFKTIYLIAIFVDLWFIATRFGQIETPHAVLLMRICLCIILLYGGFLFLDILQFDKLCGPLLVDRNICATIYIEGLIPPVLFVFVVTIRIIVCVATSLEDHHSFFKYSRILFESCCIGNCASSGQREEIKIRQTQDEKNVASHNDTENSKIDTIQLHDISIKNCDLDENTSVDKIIIKEQIIIDNVDEIIEKPQTEELLDRALNIDSNR